MATTRTRRGRGRYSDEQLAAELANALMELPENYLQCRDMRHAWAIDEDFFVAETSGRDKIVLVQRILGCMRCATQRVETYRPTRGKGLDKFRQSYIYPENYQLTNLPRGVKPADILHEEMYRRAMERMTAQLKRSSTSAQAV